MAEEQPPLMLCLENAAGEEVSLNIQPNDDFNTFLVKANELLGYEVDLNSLTRNQPVALTDNVYQFLINSENGLLEYPETQTFDQMLEPNDGTDDGLVYVLGDGTQIKASQIHFDNEDPPFDFIAEKIPFIKYVDDDIDDVEPSSEISTKVINITASPVSKWPSASSPKKPFINSIPFKLVNNNASGFAAQFHKFVESSIEKTFTPLNTVTTRNKSPRSLIRDNYKKYEDNIYNKNDFITRDEVLNMFKDTPVVPYENQNFSDKRRRKTDPSRLINKTANAKTLPYIDVDGTLIGQNESQNCFICEKFVNNNMDKLYLFDNEDQKLHRSSPQKKSSTQLKIICQQCLDNNFKPSRLKSPSKSLNADEYLVIRNNQQYIFQKTNSIDFKNIKTGFVNIGEATAIIDKIESEILKGNQVKQTDFVKVEIDSNGEIISKDDVKESNPDSYPFKDGSSSDVEIIEPEIDDVIENLEEADEELKEFLGMYQSDINDSDEFKCRFCERIFAEFTELMEHGDVHKHVTDDGEVFPCPLCFYGYTNFKWLKGHLKAAHDKSKKPPAADSKKDDKEESLTKLEPEMSPVAKRTRSSDKKNGEKQKGIIDDPENTEKDEPAKSEDPENDKQECTMEIKLEIKQEVLDTSDEEAIWIVHTDDTPADQLHSLLHGDEKIEDAVFKKPNKCEKCSQIMVDISTHKCKRRGRKRKDDNASLPSQKDTVKRAQVKTKQYSDYGDNDLQRPRKKKASEPTSDPQIMTCHNCNESYTSKVRLKFHMQFHDNTDMLDANGQYTCLECPGVTFKTETELFDHVHFQHDKQNRYQCPFKDCGKTFFLRASLTKHSRTHTDTRRYVCGTCGKRFLDKQTLDEHGVTHLQIKPYQCHICMKQLTRRSRLRMHMRAHEEALCPALVPVCAACRRAFQNVAAAVEHVKKSPECLGALSCDLNEDQSAAILSPTSGLVRATKEEEQEWVSLERESQCAGAAALLSSLPASLRPVVRAVKVDKAFRCEFCEDVFYLEEDLNSHRAIHKGVKNPFTCHICKVSFATYSRCTTHKTTHGFYKRPLADVKNEGPSRADSGPSARGVLGYGGFPVVKHFLCEDCGRSYLHWTYLQVHRRMKHANDNFIYKCIHCEETFPNSWSVAYHRKKMHGKPADKTGGATRTVNTDYRIPCRDCDEVLPNKTALYKHRKKEHSYVSLPIHDNQGLSGTRAPCTHCGLSFPADLLHHHLKEVHGQEMQYSATRSHTCTVCGHAFRTASMLTEHSRIHTGERPFPCDVCGVAFRRATAMRNHRLIHTGVRAWGCARCPKRFRIRSDLNTHSRLKHPLHLAVIEMQGLDPTSEQIMQALAVNNIARDSVLEITKVSLPKGSRHAVPDSARALALLAPAPVPVACTWTPTAAVTSAISTGECTTVPQGSRHAVPDSARALALLAPAPVPVACTWTPTAAVTSAISTGECTTVPQGSRHAVPDSARALALLAPAPVPVACTWTPTAVVTSAISTGECTTVPQGSRHAVPDSARALALLAPAPVPVACTWTPTAAVTSAISTGECTTVPQGSRHAVPDSARALALLAPAPVPVACTWTPTAAVTSAISTGECTTVPQGSRHAVPDSARALALLAPAPVPVACTWTPTAAVTSAISTGECTTVPQGSRHAVPDSARALALLAPAPVPVACTWTPTAAVTSAISTGECTTVPQGSRHAVPDSARALALLAPAPVPVACTWTPTAVVTSAISTGECTTVPQGSRHAVPDSARALALLAPAPVPVACTWTPTAAVTSAISTGECTTVPQGSRHAVPDSARALALLAPAPVPVACTWTPTAAVTSAISTANMSNITYARRGRGITRNPRPVGPPIQNLTGLNVELLLQESLLDHSALNARQMLDPMLLFTTPTPPQIQDNH